MQYEIAPPKSLAACARSTARRIDTLEHQKQKEKADKLAEVVRMWEERVKWWNNEFKYAKDFKYKGSRKGRAGGPIGRVRPESAGPGAAGHALPRRPELPVPAPAADASGLPRPRQHRIACAKPRHESAASHDPGAEEDATGSASSASPYGGETARQRGESGRPPTTSRASSSNPGSPTCPI